MVSNMEMHVKQTCGIELPCAEKITPIDIHWCLLNIYGDQTVDVNTVKQGVVHFSSGDSDMKDKAWSGRPYIAVTPQNEEHLHQLLSAHRQIMTRELHRELNINFSALKIMVAMLE